MRVVVSTDHHFWSDSEKIYCRGPGDHSFWLRYLDVFDHVIVVGRVGQLPSIPADMKPASGKGVSFAELPHYVGPWQYMLRYHQINKIVNNVIGPNDAVILRSPGQISNLVSRILIRSERPYGVEVVGDPLDVFAAGTIEVPLRPFFRWLFSQNLKRHCAAAASVAYVNKVILPYRYPANPNALQTNYSSIELKSCAFISAPREFIHNTNPLTLVSVGYMGQMYKGYDVLISAMKICTDQALKFRLILIGDGKYRKDLEYQATSFGLNERVIFTGYLEAGDHVRAQLDKADLFVLSSRTEGLPRAMIEAMARALPCIGSSVGGILELLPAEDMVRPGKPRELASKIIEVVRDPVRMSKMSKRNLEKANEYREKVLRERRKSFYRNLRIKTARWVLKRTIHSVTAN